MSIETPESGEYDDGPISLNSAERNQVTLALLEIDLAHEGIEEFTAAEYRELATIFGYEHVTVITDNDGMVSFCVTYTQSEARQRTDVYTYSPDDGLLLLEVVTRNRSDTIRQLMEQGSSLRLTYAALSLGTRAMRDLIMERLRRVEGYAAALQDYEVTQEKIIRFQVSLTVRHESEEEIEALYARRERNEAMLEEMIIAVAAVDLYFADLVRRYRTNLDAISRLKVKISALLEQIIEAEDHRSEAVPADPTEFIRLLTMIGQLERDT